jgi:hypothetical protein
VSGALVLLGGDSLAGRELIERLEGRGLGESIHLVSSDAELATLSVSAGELRAHSPDLTEALSDARAAVVCDPPSADQLERLSVAARELPVLDLSGTLEGRALDSRSVDELGHGVWTSPTASALIGAALVRAAFAAGAEGTPQVLALEPLSEIGTEAVNEMHAQAVALLNFSEMPTDVLGGQVVHDVSSPGLGGAAREARLRRDLRELAGRPVSALRVQAGVFHGAGLAVRCELSAAVWTARIASEPRLAPATTESSASPVAAVQGGRALIGRIEDDGAGGAWAWAAVDTLEHGSVGNAAELLALLP